MSRSPHPFTLRQAQYVLAVAELLSFRRAAEACRVSQPALSAQVALLEDQLGIKIFERSSQRVLLTAAGETLVRGMARTLQEADGVVDAARRVGDPLSSPLRLGVIPTIAPYLLPPLTPMLSLHFPRMTPVWTEEKTPVLVERVLAGELDAAVLALEAELGELAHAELGRDPFLLAAPPTHPLAHGEAPLPEDALLEEELLLLDEGHCLRTQALTWCARVGLRERAWRATSLGTLVQMVASGAGLTLLPRLAARAEAARANIVLRELAAPVPFRTLILAWRPRSALAEPLGRIAEVMRGALPPG